MVQRENFFDFKFKRGVFFCLAFLFLFTFKVQAQSDLGIPEGVQISPARFDLDLKSGQEYNGRINLKNYADEGYDVKIEVEDFYVSDDSTEARFFIPDSSHPLYAYDVINWIEIEGSVFLEPKEGRDIYFKIKVPEETPTGGYYGAIFFRTSEGSGEVPEDSSRVIVSQRVGTLLVMAVKGKEEIRRSGEVSKFKATKNIFFSKPAQLETELKNSGNLHYKAFGKITVKSLFGNVVETIDFTPRVLYPDRIRGYLNDWNFGLWSFGPYTAYLEAASEDKAIVMNAETVFWVIPWKTVVTILIILILIILIFKIFTSKFEIRTRKKEENKDDTTLNKEENEERKDIENQ
jgi:hypothetical protein